MGTVVGGISSHHPVVKPPACWPTIQSFAMVFHANGMDGRKLGCTSLILPILMILPILRTRQGARLIRRGFFSSDSDYSSDSSNSVLIVVGSVPLLDLVTSAESPTGLRSRVNTLRYYVLRNYAAARHPANTHYLQAGRDRWIASPNHLDHSHSQRNWLYSLSCDSLPR